MTTADRPLGYGGKLIADVFMQLWEETQDVRCIEAAEEAALRLTFGALDYHSLPDFIAGQVAGIRRRNQ